jgi:hypothetical protein
MKKNKIKLIFLKTFKNAVVDLSPETNSATYFTVFKTYIITESNTFFSCYTHQYTVFT